MMSLKKYSTKMFAFTSQNKLESHWLLNIDLKMCSWRILNPIIAREKEVKQEAFFPHTIFQYALSDTTICALGETSNAIYTSV